MKLESHRWNVADKHGGAKQLFGEKLFHSQLQNILNNSQEWLPVGDENLNVRELSRQEGKL